MKKLTCSFNPKTAIAFGTPSAKASASAHCSLRSTHHKVRLGKVQCAPARGLCEIRPKPIAVFGFLRRALGAVLLGVGAGVAVGWPGITAMAAPLSPTNLRLEYLSAPLGVDVAKPRFSWELEAAKDDKNKAQSAYRIVVVDVSKAGPGRRGEVVWNSGKVASRSTNQIVYEGKPLKPFSSYRWFVASWDENGQVSGRTPQGRSSFTTGPLSLADWAPAAWIGEPADGPGSKIGKGSYHDALPPSPYLRKEITLKKKVARAFFHSSAQGFYYLTINGEKVGSRQLAPERSVYEKHLMFQTEDVTRYLAEGKNAVGVELADGWFAGGVWGSSRRGANHGSLRKFIGQLRVTYTDGTTDVFATDGSWKFLQEGPRSNVSIMGGETFTAAKQQPGWDKPGFDDSAWGNAVSYGAPDVTTPLVAQLVEPVKIIRSFKPVSIKPAPNKVGAYIFDFGQNIAGWCRLELPYNPGNGKKITLRHFEIPNPDGSIYTANLRSARPNDVYIAGGEKTISYEPRFTFHGFRYVQVEGLEQPPKPENLTALALTSSAPESGSLETSNKDINQLWSNIRWSQWDNQISIPTDCPQRDEREGWMADAQVFAQNAIYNLDMAAFYTKWTRDIRDDQHIDGRFPDIVPNGARRTGEKYPNGKGPSGGWGNGSASPGWADAGVIVPWRTYENYGDGRLLEASFESFKRWVDFLHKNNSDLLWRNRRSNDFGDWLHGSTFRNPPDAYPRKGAEIPKEIFATAYFYYSAQITADAARILGKTADAEKYGKLAADIKKKFNETYVAADGKITQTYKDRNQQTRVLGDNQGTYAMVLALNLIPENLRANALNRLVSDLNYYDWRLSTGFHSTIWMMKQLSENGRSDVAYKLLLSRRFPSWFYSIDNGATTIWERWDGYVKGRGFQSAGMNSFNHYSLGAVGEWMYAYMAGIKFDPRNPGWTHFYLAPKPPLTPKTQPCCAGETSAKASAQKEKTSAKPNAAVSLKIVRATYGALDEPSRTIDVTAAVAGKISNNRLSLTADNETLGGDPALNTKKALRVEYVLNGAKNTVTVEEDDLLAIPVDGAAQKIRSGETTTKFTPFLDAPAEAPTWVKASYRAITGEIKAAWKIEGDTFTYEVEVPANTSATVTLPCSGKTFGIGSGKHVWTEKIK